MRIFVTGATGFVGSAIVRELLDTGHQVLGLARSEKSAQSLLAVGAQAIHGSVEDFDSLRSAVTYCDAVIHTAFNHDFSKFQESCALERQVVETLGQALEGSKRPLIVTSPIGVLPRGALATEDTMPATGAEAHPRATSEQAADVVAARGVRTAVVRLPPSVHGAGDHGFVPILIRIAREKGLAAYSGEGLNRWPAVHQKDAARVYRLVLELLLSDDSTPTTGKPALRFHAVAEEGVPFREISRVIGKRLSMPSPAMSPDDAKQYFGWFSSFAAMDVTASSRQTRDSLGWAPSEARLIPDLDQPGYFEH